MNDKGLSYKDAGVDIDAANQSVEMIKKWVGMTKRPEVLADIGSFGGFFALDNSKYREPILVSGTIRSSRRTAFFFIYLQPSRRRIEHSSISAPAMASTATVRILLSISDGTAFS